MATLFAMSKKVKRRFHITSWLNDVARPFAQCGEAQAGTPAPRFSLCYMKLNPPCEQQCFLNFICSISFNQQAFL